MKVAGQGGAVTATRPQVQRATVQASHVLWAGPALPAPHPSTASALSAGQGDGGDLGGSEAGSKATSLP